LKSNKDDESKDSGDLEQPEEESSRREFLTKSGRFALYTTPAIVALMSYDTKSAAGDNPPPPVSK
jgi:hypothetical protein